MFGKVQYKYFTPDGKVPCEGKVPTDKLPDMNTLAGVPKLSGPPFGFPPFGNCVPGGLHPFGLPNPVPGCAFGFPPPAAPAAPSWHCFPGPAAPSPWCPPSAPAPAWSVPPPPPPPAPAPAARDFSVAGSYEQEEPLPGNRVKGELAKIGSSGAGYVFPEDNVTIHLFCENVVRMYPPVNNLITTSGKDKFTTQHFPANMTFAVLIRQLGCIKRARAHPGHENYPEHLCGIQELIDVGNGRYMLGHKIMLSDPMAQQTADTYWSDSTDTAGQRRPRHIVRWPV